MKISELASRLGLSVVTSEKYSDREIGGCYIGDLLSRVMSRANANDVWITIMSNINIVAVASITDVSCILLCENIVPDCEVIKKADEENIIILKSEKKAYDLACLINGEFQNALL